MKDTKGLTLIELLLVGGIVVVLFAVVLVGVKPTHELATLRNAQRRSDLTFLLNAVSQYQLDHHGAVPAGVASLSATISKGGSDICPTLVSMYAARLPSDPMSGEYRDCQRYNTGYLIMRNPETNRVTVSAPNAELGESIFSTR